MFVTYFSIVFESLPQLQDFTNIKPRCICFVCNLSFSTSRQRQFFKNDKTNSFKIV